MPIRILLLALLPLLLPAQKLEGELKLWHRITVSFQGPDTSEDANPNPFTDYRLTVDFRHTASGRTVRVHGFYAADGVAAETSATGGRVWQAHFLPDAEGEWSFHASFRAKPWIAIDPAPEAGAPAAFDGAQGRFIIGPTDRKAPGLRGRGLLKYTGEHYLKFAGSGEYFLKGGADSPENFLAYFEFDGTYDSDSRFNEGQSSTGKPFVHRYGPHVRDWEPGDPVWQKSKGKGIIGALNYLASKGMNSVYFLTYNIDGGDGKDVWPWTGPGVRDRFDTSKLAQWEIVFSHMDRLGLMLHVVTQETENDRKLGGSPGLNNIRKLYLRELAARFAHHPALVWNLGEENNTPDPDRKAIAAWIRDIDPYDHPIGVHTHLNAARRFYNAILGSPHFEASSIQSDMAFYHEEAVELRRRSAEAGRKWAIFHDEQSPADMGVLPDSVDPDHDIPRIEALWGNLLGGGAGVEWYFGYRFPHMDLDCEDWRTRDRMWDQTRIALEFFRRYLPFWEMEPVYPPFRVAEGSPARVFAKTGEVYAIQLPRGGSVQVALPEGSYTVHWFNPRTGGELMQGDVQELNGGKGRRWLGLPPSERSRDWVVLIRKKR